MTSPDLPQFDAAHLSGGWTEISSAYDLSPFIFSLPVALQTVTNDGRRALCTGVLTATEDRFRAAESGEDSLVESVFYFKDSPHVTIVWADVKGVVGMVAIEQESAS